MARVLLMAIFAVFVAFAAAKPEKRFISSDQIMGALGTAMSFVQSVDTTETVNGMTLDIHLSRCSITFGKRWFVSSVGDAFKDLGSAIGNVAVDAVNAITPGTECSARICVRGANLCGSGEGGSRETAIKRATEDLARKAG